MKSKSNKIRERYNEAAPGIRVKAGDQHEYFCRQFVVYLH